MPPNPPNEPTSLDAVKVLAKLAASLGPLSVTVLRRRVPGKLGILYDLG
jgi:hypothetical protein